MTTDLYRRYINSPIWKAKRLERLRKAEWNGYGYCKCERCGALTWQGDIHVHHTTYERLGRERMEDLEVICTDCQEKEHGKPIAWRPGLHHISEILRALSLISARQEWMAKHGKNRRA